MERLDNPVRDYPWGSATDVPEFLGVEPGAGPVAELWIGAHPDSPSRVSRDGAARSLAEVIGTQPEAALGAWLVSRFGPALPFLLKVLSAARPLSLQVHPDKDYAARAYAAQEQGPGGPRDYTDGNHKPEIICALRDGFAGLDGFRPLPGTRALLAELDVPDLGWLAAGLDDADPAASLREVVTSALAGQADWRAVIAGVRAACERVAGHGGPWGLACAAYAGVAAAYPADPGVLVALLLNYVELAASEAVFVGAGVPHCYLHGFGAELMASSDNVLRAGLTSKRVNVPELLRVLDFTPAEPEVLRAQPEPDGIEAVYRTPADDFRLSRLDLVTERAALPAGRPQLLLCVEGTAELQDSAGSGLELRRGQSVFIPAAESGVSICGKATVLRATTAS
jgi:mannose-6-phosphate isomerase